MAWMLDRPRLALALLTALLLLPLPFLLRIDLNNAPETYLPASTPAVLFTAALRQQFPDDQVLVALFEGERLFEPYLLEQLHALALSLESDARVERVLTLTTSDHIRATPDGFLVEPLADPRILSRHEAEFWRERAVTDRFAPGLLVAPDGSGLAMVVRPHGLDNSLERLALYRLLTESVSRHGLAGELAAVSGLVALDVAQLLAMFHDLVLLIPGTMGIGLFLLWWLFRRGIVVLVAGVTIAAVMGLALSLLVLASEPFTLVSAIIPPMLVALTVAMLMHLFNARLHAARRGLQGRAGMDAALHSVARPIVFTALTTAAGLASLTVSPIRPVSAFGLVAAAGVLSAAAAVLLLLPAILVRWDGEWHTAGRRGMGWLDGITRLAARLAVRRAGWIALVALLLLAAAVPWIRDVQVETDLYAFFAEGHEITLANRKIEDRLSGVMALEVVFDGPDWESLMDPARLRAIHAVQEWLDQRPEVDYSLSLADLVAEMHWAFNEEDPAFRRVPENAALIAQYLFIYDGRDLFDLVDRDFMRTRLMLNLNAHGARAINALMADLRRHLAANPPADLDWEVAGIARLFADQERLLILGQVRGLIAVCILLLGLMLLMWRSVPLAAISMVPNLAPVVLIFAMMGLLGIWLDMATAMIASVAVGIAVDDTIHVMHGYLQRLRAGAPVAWAIARTFRQTGRAVTATTLVLCAQFGLLALSDFQPTNAFGLLTAFGLLVALAFDLLVLPAVLVLLHRRR